MNDSYSVVPPAVHDAADAIAGHSFDVHSTAGSVSGMLGTAAGAAAHANASEAIQGFCQHAQLNLNALAEQTEKFARALHESADAYTAANTSTAENFT